MSDTNDWELLNRYAAERSQEAFASLVAKYADLVFSTALRTTRNRTLAEDVTQAVFIVLARSAGSLSRKGSLAGWLHKTALYAASNALRSELRRKKRERRAARDESVNSDNSENQAKAIAIEQELHRLPATDRNLLAFHYLEGMTMAQSADKVGLTHEAARKRLSRALAKLRSRLGTIPAVTITATLGAIGASSKSEGANQIASNVIAGGKNGNAFNLASEIIRHARLLALGKIAAMILLLLTCALGIAVAQVGSAPTTPVASQPLTQQIRPATQPQTVVELPRVVHDALIRNAQQLNPITIQWTQSGSSRLSVEEAAKTMRLSTKSADYSINLRATFFVAYRDAKYATWYSMEPMDAKYGNQVMASGIVDETSFDGEFFYSAMRWNGKHGGMIWKHDFSTFGEGHDEDRYVNAGYFTDIGLPLSARLIDLKQHQLARSQILFLLEHGAKLNSIQDMDLNGRRLIRVRMVGEDPNWKSAQTEDPEKTRAIFRRGPNLAEDVEYVIEAISKRKLLPQNRLYDFFLDPQLNYALRRYEERYDDVTLLRRIDCDDFERLAGRDLYLPHKCVESDFTGSNIPGTYFKEPLLVYTSQVTQIKLEPHPDGGFSLANLIVPGVRMTEVIDGKQTIYVLEEDGTKTPVTR